MAAPKGNLNIVESSDDSDDHQSTTGNTETKSTCKARGSSGKNRKKGKQHKKQNETPEVHDAVQPDHATETHPKSHNKKGKEWKKAQSAKTEHPTRNRKSALGPRGQCVQPTGNMNSGVGDEQVNVQGINPQQMYPSFPGVPPQGAMPPPPFPTHMPPPFAGSYYGPGMATCNNMYGQDFNRMAGPSNMYTGGNYPGMYPVNMPPNTNFGHGINVNNQGTFPQNFQGDIQDRPAHPRQERHGNDKSNDKFSGGHRGSKPDTSQKGNNERGRGGTGGRHRRGGAKHGRDNRRNDNMHTGNSTGRDYDGVDRPDRGDKRRPGNRGRGKGRRHKVSSGDGNHGKERKKYAEDESDALKIDARDVFQFLVKECRAFISYEKFLEKCSLFPGDADVERWFYKNRSCFRIYYKEGKIIYLSVKKGDAKMCLSHRSNHRCEREDCSHLHICPDYVKGWCKYKEKCQLNHSFAKDERNTKVIQRLELSAFSDVEIANILKWQKPQLCPYTKSPCRRGENCPYLHMCSYYMLRNTCKYGSNCKLGHSFDTRHNEWILKTYRMEDWPKDQKKRRILNKTVIIRRFPPRKPENEHGDETQIEDEDEEDLDGHDSDVTEMSDDTMSTFSDLESVVETLSDESRDMSDSSDENSETDSSEEEEEAEVHSRKNRFDQDTDYSIFYQ